MKQGITPVAIVLVSDSAVFARVAQHDFGNPLKAREETRNFASQVDEYGVVIRHFGMTDGDRRAGGGREQAAGEAGVAVPAVVVGRVGLPVLGLAGRLLQVPAMEHPPACSRHF